MDTAPLFQLEAIRHSLSSSFTLEIERLDVARGETLCLVGPTGAGKTTLLRLLSGLVKVSSGLLTFSSAPFVSATLPVQTQRRIAFVPQRPLMMSMSVRKNIQYGLTVRKERDTEKRVAAILHRTGLESIASQNAQTLSGGQMQLVALARALVVEPDVLLLDEPTAHLDPAHVALVEDLVREQQQHRPTTVIWATHNLFQTRRVAMRVALLLNGKLVEVADTETFFENPTSPLTADFTQGKMVY